MPGGMAKGTRVTIMNGRQQAMSSSAISDAMSSGVQILLGPEIYSEASNLADRKGLAILADRASLLQLPPVSVPSGGIIYMRPMGGARGRLPTAAESSAWQLVAYDAQLSPGGEPMAVLGWVESLPGMSVLVVWRRAVHSSEMERMAALLESAADAEFGAAAFAAAPPAPPPAPPPQAYSPPPPPPRPAPHQPAPPSPARNSANSYTPVSETPRSSGAAVRWIVITALLAAAAATYFVLI